MGFAPFAHAATVEEVIKTVRSLAPAQRKAALEEGAKKEGQLAWYTSMSSTASKGRGGFRKIRSGVKVNAYRLAQSSIMNKIDTEARAGRYAVDIVTASPVEMWELKQKNYSTSYLSPELKAFPSGAYDPQGFWSSFEVTPIVLAFNTKQVTQEEAPKAIRICSCPNGKAR